MLLAILEAIISGIVIEVIFNAWHKRHQILDIIQQRETKPQAAIETTPEEVPSEPQATSKPPKTTTTTTPTMHSLLKQLRPFRMIARVFVAGLTGFIIGGLVAGIVEAETAREIALGSGAFFLYIGIPMALTWLLLWTTGPLKHVTLD